MANRLTKITTRTGDDGTTGLGDGSRVSKAEPRIQTLGELDELNCALGLVLTEPLPEDIARHLTAIQNDLFDLGGEIAIPASRLLEVARVAALDDMLTHYNASLAPLKEFILPGGSRASALAHVARAICRRAERALVTLAADEAVSPTAIQYINRLSDLMFVFARVLNRHAGRPDVFWARNKP